jgi:DNA-binding response OmpR family regulator
MPVRLLCRINLEAEGLGVLEAADGVDGLEQARATTPDLILLDVMLPLLDGWQVAQELAADPATERIPIIFMSARADFADQAKGIDIGGIDYLTKPFDPVYLGQLVRQVIDRVDRGEAQELRAEKLEALRRRFDDS